MKVSISKYKHVQRKKKTKCKRKMQKPTLLFSSLSHHVSERQGLTCSAVRLHAVQELHEGKIADSRQ